MFKQIKLSKLNQKIQKTAHKEFFCSLQSNPAPAIVNGQRVDCFGVTAGSCCSPRYFTASERKICIQKDNKTM